MKCNVSVKALLTIALIAMIWGCRPATAPESTEPSSVPSATTPVPIPNTATPVPSVTSGSKAETAVLLHTLSGHGRRVLDVAFSAEGEFLASSGQDLKIRLWDVESGRELHTFPMNSVDMADIDIWIGGNLLASAEAIWDLASLQEIHVLERGSPLPGSVAFSPDGSTLAVGLFEQQITLWDVASGQPVYTFARQEENRTKRMDFSPDGALLAVGVIDGTVRLLDVASGEILKVLKYNGETDIHDLAFSPDGRYLATGGRALAAILWDIPGGEVIRTFRLTDNAIALAFSPDGTILATAGGYEHEIRLWDVEGGDLLHSLPHPDQLSSVAFSPDGRRLAVGCFDGNVYLWQIPVNP